VYVELPEIGATVTGGDPCGVVESVKAASDLISPVSGEISDVNGHLSDNPSMVNQQPQSDGWIFKLKLSDASELDNLMDEEAYTKFVAAEGGQ